MAMKTTDEALLRSAVEAVEAAGSVAGAARAEGISRETLRSRYNRAKQVLGHISAVRSTKTPTAPVQTMADEVDHNTGKRSLTIPVELEPGVRVVGIRSLEDAIAFHGIDLAEWRIVRHRVNSWGSPSGDGDKVSCQVRIDLEPVAALPVLDAARRLAERLPVRSVVAKPRQPRRDAPLVVCGPYDVHLGQLVWSGETPHDDDIRLTSDRFRSAIDGVAERFGRETPRKIIVPFGNDFIHFENERAETASGKHAVDYDSRYAKIIEVGHGLIEHMIDRFLELGAEVEVVYVPDNHAPLASYHLAHWIKQRYSRERRVEVDTGFAKFKFREHGVNLLGLTHGHHMKLSALYDVMAEHAADMWAGKRTRDWHIGHFHEAATFAPRGPGKGSQGSVQVRQNPSLSMTSRYAHNLGYVGTPAIAAFIYDYANGYAGEMIESMPAV